MVDRVLIIGLYVALACFMAAATHHFFSYIAHYPYWSVDDGLAVISSSWVQTGRYGDPSIPLEMMSNTQRYNGFFIYGPWSFAAGALTVWLFGFSVQALRAWHLLAALSLTLVGVRLFTGLRGAIVTALLGVTLAYTAVQIQWPMVRPDPFVTLFAAGAVWTAARAIQTGRVRWWYGCGIAAACAALSHPAAASIVLASFVAMLAAVAISRAPFVRGLISLVAGGLTSTLVFYASFGFRIGDQLAHIQRYREEVAALTRATVGNTSLAAVWAEHYRIASSGVPGMAVAIVIATAVIAALLTAWALWRRQDPRAPELVALLTPGVSILLLYVLSLGFYSNFHTGYVILPQLMSLWIAAAVVYISLGAIRGRTMIGTLAERLLAVGVLVLIASGAVAIAKSPDDPRVALTQSWIAIPEYMDEVLGPVPQHAVAWGAAPLAAEGPERVQLVGLDAALRVMSKIPHDRRPKLVPDYLVWGHQATRDALVNPYVAAAEEPLNLLSSLMPDNEFTLASIVSAAPYGATRIFQRRLSPPPAPGLPNVSAWDDRLHRWMHGVAPVERVVWEAAPGHIRITKQDQHWDREATDGRRAPLPAGWYLLRITTSGSTGRQFVTAASGTDHDYRVGDLPPDMDVAPRFDTEPLYVMRHHTGGDLGVNLFADDASAEVRSIDTFRVSGLADYGEDRARLAESPLPSPTTWVPDAGGGVTVRPEGESAVVEGNGSQWGYQLVSPAIAVQPDVEVSVRLPVTTVSGRVCTGILDQDQQWIVRPLDQADTHRFSSGRNRQISVVVSNCNANGAQAPSRFTVGRGGIAMLGDRWYVDTLMREYDNRPR